ncbi:MAG TPA: ribosome maturation factor RimM [Candidatus Limnocylindrales bacterium]|nr:ribosome maturation factor RimM [Candidatus Limnocylindrales bacterium]
MARSRSRSSEPGSPAAGPTRLVVGRVRGVHGLRGLVRVEVLTDRPEDRFAPGVVLYREGNDTPLTVESAAPIEDGPGWRIGFREVRDRTAADRLRLAYLEVAVDCQAELAPGQAFWHEVVGSPVTGVDGRLLGHVADIYRAGETEVYVVRGGPVGEFDLPAVAGIIRTFDPRGNGIAVDEAALDLGGRAVDRPPRPGRRAPRWSRHGKGGPRGEAST